MIFRRKASDLLADWKKTWSGKYAALLEGPRRVGKSTIAEEFAKANYRSYIKVNFAEVGADVLSVFDSIDNLDDFFLRLQNAARKNLYMHESVIILDEIQLQPKVRQAIKHLVSDGRYDYIETGSLLSIKKNVKNIVIPSEEMKIPVYPMDYEEFLWAIGSEEAPLLKRIYESGKPVGQAVNRSKMRSFRTYMAVGGMPQAVEAYIDKLPFSRIDRIKRTIIDLYEDDFYKIDPSGRISMLFESIPSQLARTSKSFSLGFALNKKSRAKDYELLYDLVNSRTVIPCYNCTDPRVSLSQSRDPDTFKLYMADTGLFVSLLLKTGAASEDYLYGKMLSDKLPANLGFLYENIVAQTLFSGGNGLYYMTWPKEGSTHSYEIDFLARQGTKTTPLEVKSARTDTHASLDEFIRKYSSVVKDPCILSQKDIGSDGIIRLYPFYLTEFVARQKEQ
ncbi:MAG: ATP-binding protein [Spirochaetales bacterium]|nr:ATP-binding protein [Spirochaetales bacterium]